MARDLKLELNTGYWSSGPPPGIAETVAEAEKLGFDSLWAAEAYGSDVLTPPAWGGAGTTKVPLRHPPRPSHLRARGNTSRSCATSSLARTAYPRRARTIRSPTRAAPAWAS